MIGVGLDVGAAHGIYGDVVGDGTPSGPALEGHRYWKVIFSAGWRVKATRVQELQWYASELGIDLLPSAAVGTDAIIHLSEIAGLPALSDGDLTTNTGHMAFKTGGGAEQGINIDFGVETDLHHLRMHDIGYAPSTESIGKTSRGAAIYHSDDGLTYTLHFVSYIDPQDPATWHTINSPEVAGIFATDPQPWLGIYARISALGNGKIHIQELDYKLAGVSVLNYANLPVRNVPIHWKGASASNPDHVFENNTDRFYTQSNTGIAPINGILHELSSPLLADSISMTSESGISDSTYMPREGALIAGDGTTFVPVVEFSGQVGWGINETRTFT